MSKNIKTVFFDAGFTLLYPYRSVGEIYAQVARDHGLMVEAERMEQAFRAAWTECRAMPRAGQSLLMDDEAWWRDVVFRSLDVVGGDVTNREAYFRELYDLFADPKVWRLFPDAKPTLAELSQRGYKLGIISNWDKRLRPLLEGLGILDYFQTVTISSEVGTEKPDAAIFLRALRDAGATADAALHVGDSWRDDVLGAQRVGIRAVLIERNDATEDCQCVRIRSLTELLLPDGPLCDSRYEDGRE